MFSSWLSSKREESVHPSRAAKERPLPLLSLGVVDLFRRCNPAFQGLHSVPRRTLTQPSDPVFNGGLDNADHNLICRVHDTLTPESKADGGGGESQYVILDNLGQGTFGQVFRCQEVETGRIVAVKIIRNKPAYLSQAWIEVKIAKLLNDRFDPNDENNILRLLSFFMYRNHLCLVFELLSINVYELLKQNQFRGLPLATIRPFAQQVLQALKVLQDARIIHCDLKPENILLRLEPPAAGGSEAGNGRKSPGDPSSSGAVVPATPPASMPSTAPPQDSSSSSGGGGGKPPGTPQSVKVIDFGSACFENQSMFSYIQSRFYRSPEVLLGLPYDGAIDMWSFGCICAEMFLGLPLFPGVSEHNQLCRVVEMLGHPPDCMLEAGKHTGKFYSRCSSDTIPTTTTQDQLQATPSATATPTSRFSLKTPEEYARDTRTEVPASKKYFKHTRLPDIINSYPMKKGLTAEDQRKEKELRRCLVHFLLATLRVAPHERLTPKQAMAHPFITGLPLGDEGVWRPPQDLKTTDRALAYMQRGRGARGTMGSTQPAVRDGIVCDPSSPPRGRSAGREGSAKEEASSSSPPPEGSTGQAPNPSATGATALPAAAQIPPATTLPDSAPPAPSAATTASLHMASSMPATSSLTQALRAAPPRPAAALPEGDGGLGVPLPPSAMDPTLQQSRYLGAVPHGYNQPPQGLMTTAAAVAAMGGLGAVDSRYAVGSFPYQSPVDDMAGHAYSYAPGGPPLQPSDFAYALQRPHAHLIVSPSGTGFSPGSASYMSPPRAHPGRHRTRSDPVLPAPPEALPSFPPAAGEGPPPGGAQLPSSQSIPYHQHIQQLQHQQRASLGAMIHSPWGSPMTMQAPGLWHGGGYDYGRDMVSAMSVSPGTSGLGGGGAAGYPPYGFTPPSAHPMHAPRSREDARSGAKTRPEATSTAEPHVTDQGNGPLDLPLGQGATSSTDPGQQGRRPQAKQGKYSSGLHRQLHGPSSADIGGAATYDQEVDREPPPHSAAPSYMPSVPMYYPPMYYHSSPGSWEIQAYRGAMARGGVPGMVDQQPQYGAHGAPYGMLPSPMSMALPQVASMPHHQMYPVIDGRRRQQPHDQQQGQRQRQQQQQPPSHYP